jgi:surface polysaccharide O-acyltransferase-like enzyme
LALERAVNIDRLRILAAFGVVWFHTEGAPYRLIGYAGLPIFLLAFFSLIVRNARAGDTACFLKRRCNRLILPWLFWSVVYGLCKFAKAICTMDMDALRGVYSVENLLAGTHIHLWYLPYAFLLGFLIHEVNRRTSRVNNTVVVLAATAIGMFLLAARPSGIFASYVRPPLPQWSFGLAAVSLGFAIGRCLVIGSHDARKLLLLAVALPTLLACIILIWAGSASPAVPYGLAMALVCIAYVWPVRSDVFVAAVAPLTFGIYLIHPLISFGLRHILAKQHCVIFIVLTACISGLVTFGLRKTPLRRFV